MIKIIIGIVGIIILFSLYRCVVVSKQADEELYRISLKDKGHGIQESGE